MKACALAIGRLAVFVTVLTILASRDAAAQRRPQDPHVAYAYPAGCQLGTSCEVVVGGQYLKDAAAAHLTGDGVTMEVLGWYRPMTRGEYNSLRMELQLAREELLEQREKSGLRSKPSEDEVALAAGVTAEQRREMEIYLRRERDPKRQPNEQLHEEVTLKLTVARNAKPGKRELRMLTETSMSNPIWIHVGQWPEVRETEPNDVEPDDVVDELPIVVNGQIMPGDTDRFSFDAKQGMRLVVQAAARDVIPYLADAVPGWFQAVMVLTDSAGNEVAYADAFHYRQDPVIYFEVPRDDRYTVTIRDTLYRGREDFVYRITLGELPFVTSVFPLGAQTDSEVTLELRGWNLSQQTLDVRTKSRRSYRPLRWFTLPQEGGTSVRFPLQINRLPEVLDTEPNNTLADSQDVTTRTIINGRIDHPGDRDVYRIEGRGRVVAEVHARRHGSPVDSMLLLTDSDGRELAFNDDFEDKSQALLTHHADSHLTATLSGTGASYLHVSDAQGKGGRDFIYRLYLRAPEPDFELRVVPSSIIARPGAVVPITVFVLRRDEFKQDVELALVDSPTGFQLTGGVVPGGADYERMTVTLPATATDEPVVLEMEGRARGGRRPLVRPAVPAENMMQAFIWHHLVPVEEWNVVVSGRQGARAPFEVAPLSGRVKLPVGGKALVPVRLSSKGAVVEELRVELQEPPPGVSAQLIAGESGKVAVQLSSEKDVVESGLRANLLLRAYRETTPEATDSNPDPQPRRTDYGYLPAIPIQVGGR